MIAAVADSAIWPHVDRLRNVLVLAFQLPALLDLSFITPKKLTLPEIGPADLGELAMDVDSVVIVQLQAKEVVFVARIAPSPISSFYFGLRRKDQLG